MIKIKSLILVIFFALIAFTCCKNSINSEPEQGGTLSISINASGRCILPGLNMNPYSYYLTGAGPNGDTFSQIVISGSSAIITDLAVGEWAITAIAKNVEDAAIGQGSGSITVLSNASVSLSINLRPYDGFGALELNVSWPAAQVQSPQIQSTMTPSDGSARNLAFEVNRSTGNASFSASELATGYHTLIVKLLDNGHLAIGAVEVIRIVKDQPTRGIIAFANVNPTTGTLEVNITPERADPLGVRIRGSAATKPANQGLNLSALVSNQLEKVTYMWYVNGDAVASGASYTFGDSFALGYYRIDVTAFNINDKRAYSASTTIQVVGAVASHTHEKWLPLNMVTVPAGRFQRDAKATNISEITQPYRMSSHEITRAQFLSIMGTDPNQTAVPSDNSNPVVSNWYQAIAFCNKLSLVEGLTPVYSVTEGGTPINWASLNYSAIPRFTNSDWNAATASWANNGYRLPTEMEWMWAAMGAPSDGQKGGINTSGYLKGYAGSTEESGQSNIGTYAWYFSNSKGTSQPVGGKTANELGLYDMSGNVGEYTWDWYARYPDGILTDYRGAASGESRVMRGGFWGDFSSYCSIAFRGASNQEIQFLGGFRVVRP